MSDVMDFITWLLGLSVEAHDLDVSRTMLRALIFFLIAVVLIRVGDQRFMGRHTALDVMLGIVYGSVASRAINGSAHLIPTIGACIALVAIHWTLSALTFRSHKFGYFVKGGVTQLVSNGRPECDKMRRCHITAHDLEEAIRQHGHAPNIEKVETAYLERNGNISVIMKKSERRPATNRPPESA